MSASDYAPAETLAFADLAEQEGEPDMAIAALEQMLQRHPGHSEAEGRLSQLYAKVGNQVLAEQFGGDEPEEQPSRTHVWARVSAGMAYDTNPTNAESSETIRIFDALNRVFVNVASQNREPDLAATASVDLGVLHRMSPDTLLAAEVSVAAERYGKHEDLDTFSANVTVGPWLTIRDTLYLRPYVNAGGATLAGDLYYATLGGGAELRFEVSDSVSGWLDLSVLYLNYDGGVSSTFPINRLDNVRLELQAGLSGSTDGGLGYSVQTTLGISEADTTPESIAYAGLEGAVSYPISSFEQALGMPLTFQMGGSADWTLYRDADPVIDPNEARQDLWLGGNGALILGLTDTLDLTIGADYVRRFSNVAAFDSQNLRLFTRVGYSF